MDINSLAVLPKLPVRFKWQRNAESLECMRWTAQQVSDANRHCTSFGTECETLGLVAYLDSGRGPQQRAEQHNLAAHKQAHSHDPCLLHLRP